jgi:uncharacterized membrane protein YozB (DUF420 family)
MKHLLTPFLTLVFALPALAHEMPAHHAHPHPDLNMVIVLGLVVLIAGLGFVAVKSLRAHKKENRHDPR